MANERDDEQFNETGSQNQSPPTDQQGQQQPTDQQGQQPVDQAGQSSSGQAQPSGGTDTLTTDQGTASGQSGGDSSSPAGEGFIGSQPSGSDEHIQQGGSSDVETGAASAQATDGTDFAEKGQGASDEIEDEGDQDGSGNTGGGGGF